MKLLLFIKPTNRKISKAAKSEIASEIVNRIIKSLGTNNVRNIN
jgi:hypothetical protein